MNNTEEVLFSNPIEAIAPISGLATILYTKETTSYGLLVSINNVYVTQLHNWGPYSTKGIFPVFVKKGDVIKVTCNNPNDTVNPFYVISIDIQEIEWQ